MIAEKIHIYSPDEIDKIEPMSELERCAGYLYQGIKDYSDHSKVYGLRKNVTLFIGDKFNTETLQRMVQLLANAGWDIVLDDRIVIINKRHFE